MVAAVFDHSGSRNSSSLTAMIPSSSTKAYEEPIYPMLQSWIKFQQENAAVAVAVVVVVAAAVAVAVAAAVAVVVAFAAVAAVAFVADDVKSMSSRRRLLEMRQICIATAYAQKNLSPTSSSVTKAAARWRP
jgi:predicted alpha/beta hydrolase family esterase